MPDERRQDRLEREINEILAHIDQFPPPERRWVRSGRRALRRLGDRVSAWQRSVMRAMSGVSLSQLMLLAFLMILGSMFFRRVVPLAWPWLMYGGIILFLVSFTLMFLGRSTDNSAAAQYWRGRRMQYTPQPSLMLRLRQWWARYARR